MYKFNFVDGKVFTKDEEKEEIKKDDTITCKVMNSALNYSHGMLVWNLLFES